jgi:hypothetical protein
VPDPPLVVGLDEVPGLPELLELPPHAARSDAQATDAMATVRSCTTGIVPSASREPQSGRRRERGRR